MKFRNEIMISYSHIDNQPLQENEKGWVSEFHVILEKFLAEKLGKQPNIWRDRELDGNSVFDDEILHEIQSAGIMVSILSPRYIESDYCRLEIDSFKEKAIKEGLGLKVNDKSRFFKVIKTPVSIDDHPTEMKDTLGYEFYQRMENNRYKEFRRYFGPDYERMYYNKIDDLAYDLCDMIKHLQDPNLNKPLKGTIYLAEVTPDLEEERNIIKRELQKEYFIVPDEQLPIRGEAFRNRVNELLQDAVMTIHLFGHEYDYVPQGEDNSAAHIQNELAVAYASANDVPRLIWMPPGLSPQDRRQYSLVDFVRTDPLAITNAEVIEAPIEKLKSAIDDAFEKLRRKELEQTKTAAASNEDDGEHAIYLICDERDIDEIEEIYETLSDLDYEVVLPNFEEEDPKALREHHEQSIVECDSVIIYYGNANELWLKKKLMDLKKIGIKRSADFKARSIYIGPPEHKKKAAYTNNTIPVIQGTGGFSPDLLDSFIERLNSNSEPV